MTFTKERLEQYINNPLEHGLTRSEQMEMARIALAVITAPIAPVITGEDAENIMARFREMNSRPGCQQLIVAEPVQDQHESAGSACKCRSSEKVQELKSGWVAVPVDMTPEQIRSVQLNSELGAYAAANLSGAYSLFREFWDVAIAAAPQQEA